MGMTRHEQLSTDWIEDADHGGMLLAVVAHLGDADRDLLAGMAAAGDSAYAVVLDVSTWDRTGRRGEPATAALRRGGWKATTLENATARWRPPGWSSPDDRPDDGGVPPHRSGDSHRSPRP